MEVHFAPEIEQKIYETVAEQGHGTADDFVRDAVAGHLDELARLRAMLDRRYDEAISGTVKAFSGEEVAEYFPPQV